ncbi:DUF6214 family protein [Streptomyces sp. NPDC088116]|uniref:DUF6214 family protein n=1 Tax=Streptomyces sp. NPDC088116 TaxID=3365825 RepID=UPI0038030495
MSEHESISAQEPHERDAHDACEWPVWEVQGHGTVTGAGDPRDGAARYEILPPWVDIRLTFADGARVDVLAVVRDGRIAIEDAQADPPLALDGFAALAEAIEAPLQSACQVIVGPHRPPAPHPAVSESARSESAQDGPERSEPRRDAAVRGGPAGPELMGPEVTGPEPAGPQAEPARMEPLGAGPVAAGAVVGGFDSDAAPHDEPERRGEPGLEARLESRPEPVPGPGSDQDPEPLSEPVEGPALEQPSSGRHRARPNLPRGSAARRTVAEIYRAAQQAGTDPVLAVMSVTGFSRRKSLRLIAGARDEGHLTPRHHRR